MTAQVIPDLSGLAEEPTNIYISLKPSHRANVLASVVIEIETNLGTITISDGRRFAKATSDPDCESASSKYQPYD